MCEIHLSSRCQLIRRGLGSRHNHHWAGSMVSTVSADRSQQNGPNRTHGAGADDQKTSVLGRLHEQDPGIPLERPGRHGDRWRVAQYPSHGGILTLLRRPAQIIRRGLTTQRQIGSDRYRLDTPGRDYFDRVSRPLGLTDGEPQCRITFRPALNPDNDESLGVIHESLPALNGRIRSAFCASFSASLQVHAPSPGQPGSEAKVPPHHRVSSTRGRGCEEPSSWYGKHRARWPVSPRTPSTGARPRSTGPSFQGVRNEQPNRPRIP